MPSKMRGSEYKTEMLAVRVTKPIKDAVIMAAQSEGLDVSEWMRSLIISELRRRSLLLNCVGGDRGE
jgi:uncharacterized protein (DUF1778 family)